MNLKPFLVRLSLILFFATACASSPESPPAWILNTNNVYPRGEFITGRGQGTTRNEAEIRAVMVISQFFLSQVSTEQGTRSVWNTGPEGNTNTERQTWEGIAIESQVQLMTVRFAEDPWHDPRTKIWENIAYISRDEGWAVYEPTAKRQSDRLLAIIEAADTETIPFNAFLRYGNAMAYADSSDYTGTRAFAYVLHPTRASSLFAEANAAEGTLVRKQLAAQERSRVYIEILGDYNNMIYQAAVKALGNAGFTVEQNRNNALTYLHVQVEEGQRTEDVGVSYYPALTGIISGKDGSLFAFKVEATRQSAINPDVAKRRAYTALANVLESAFFYELEEYQKVLVRT